MSKKKLNKTHEPWRAIHWYGNYYHGYFGDDDGTYEGSDYAEIRIGDFKNKFRYKADLGSRDIHGKYRLHIRYEYDYQTYGEVFYGKFKTKRKAKIAAFKEIHKFENDRERVMEMWRNVMNKERRVAIFKANDFDQKSFEWIASGFAGTNACSVVSEERSPYRSSLPSYSGISSGANLFLSFGRGCDWEADYPYVWSSCECSSGCMSGGGGKEFVTDALQEIEPDIINCLRNAEFNEKKYKWMLLRQNNYKSVDNSILVEK